MYSTATSTFRRDGLLNRHAVLSDFGARAIGMDKELGSLEAGKRADVIVVSMRGARQTPMYDPVSHLVYVSRGDDVRTTIVNGKVLMRDRRVLTLDEKAVLEDAAAWAAKVRAAVGGGGSGGKESVKEVRATTSPG